MKEIIPFIFVFISLGTSAQRQTDSIKTKTLKEVTLEANRFQQDITRLAEVQGMFIFSGKKNEVIDVTQKNLAVSEKYARQLFAKVPGVFVYDMDGTGNQLNISTRGLDAHRGWDGIGIIQCHLAIPISLSKTRKILASLRPANQRQKTSW